MARTNNTGCLCRVPVDEAAVPSFLTHAELEQWCQREGVDLALDHRGRWSIPLATAYELYERTSRATAAAAAEQEEKAAREKQAVREAQVKRQAVYEAAHRRVLRRGKSAAEASLIAWEAVHEAEERLPQRVKDQLGPVRVVVA